MAVVVAIWCKGCCGRREETVDEPLMKVPPIPGGGARSFRSTSADTSPVTSGDNYYRRQQVCRLPATAPCALIIVVWIGASADT